MPCHGKKVVGVFQNKHAMTLPDGDVGFGLEALGSLGDQRQGLAVKLFGSSK